MNSRTPTVCANTAMLIVDRNLDPDVLAEGLYEEEDVD